MGCCLVVISYISYAMGGGYFIMGSTCYASNARHFADGMALPCVNNMIARWFPEIERARAVGIAMARFQLWKCNRTHAISNPLVKRQYIWSICDFWTIWIPVGFGLVICNIMYS